MVLFVEVPVVVLAVVRVVVVVVVRVVVMVVVLVVVLVVVVVVLPVLSIVPLLVLLDFLCTWCRTCSWMAFVAGPRMCTGSDSTWQHIKDMCWEMRRWWLLLHLWDLEACLLWPGETTSELFSRKGTCTRCHANPP